MRFQKFRFILLFLAVAALSSCDHQEKPNESAIQESIRAYEHAFNNKDAKALAALWSDDGIYVAPESGNTVEGKEAITAKFESYFKSRPNTKIEITTESITFPNKDEAIETATANITENGDSIARMAYRAFYENQDGNWLISEIREVATTNPPEPSLHLKEISWLIGDWVDEDDDVIIASSYQWDRYHAFITQKFSVTSEGKFELEGKQIIGWDPVNERIRSWIFDSDGGYGEGKWKKEGDSWVIEIASTLADGRRASSINTITPIDNDRYTAQSTGRSVGSELQPDIDPVTVVRKK